MDCPMRISLSILIRSPSSTGTELRKLESPTLPANCRHPVPNFAHPYLGLSLDCPPRRGFWWNAPEDVSVKPGFLELGGANTRVCPGFLQQSEPWVSSAQPMNRTTCPPLPTSYETEWISRRTVLAPPQKGKSKNAYLLNHLGRLHL